MADAEGMDSGNAYEDDSISVLFDVNVKGLDKLKELDNAINKIQGKAKDINLSVDSAGVASANTGGGSKESYTPLFKGVLGTFQTLATLAKKAVDAIGKYDKEMNKIVTKYDYILGMSAATLLSTQTARNFSHLDNNAEFQSYGVTSGSLFNSMFQWQKMQSNLRNGGKLPEEWVTRMTQLAQWSGVTELADIEQYLLNNNAEEVMKKYLTAIEKVAQKAREGDKEAKERIVQLLNDGIATQFMPQGLVHLFLGTTRQGSTVDYMWNNFAYPYGDIGESAYYTGEENQYNDFQAGRKNISDSLAAKKGKEYKESQSNWTEQQKLDWAFLLANISNFFWGDDSNESIDLNKYHVFGETKQQNADIFSNASKKDREKNYKLFQAFVSTKKSGRNTATGQDITPKTETDYLMGIIDSKKSTPEEKRKAMYDMTFAADVVNQLNGYKVNDLLQRLPKMIARDLLSGKLDAREFAKKVFGDADGAGYNYTHQLWMDIKNKKLTEKELAGKIYDYLAKDVVAQSRTKVGNTSEAVVDSYKKDEKGNKIRMLGFEDAYGNRKFYEVGKDVTIDRNNDVYKREVKDLLDIKELASNYVSEMLANFVKKGLLTQESMYAEMYRGFLEAFTTSDKEGRFVNATAINQDELLKNILLVWGSAVGNKLGKHGGYNDIAVTNVQGTPDSKDFTLTVVIKNLIDNTEQTIKITPQNQNFGGE